MTNGNRPNCYEMFDPLNQPSNLSFQHATVTAYQVVASSTRSSTNGPDMADTASIAETTRSDQTANVVVTIISDNRMLIGVSHATVTPLVCYYYYYYYVIWGTHLVQRGGVEETARARVRWAMFKELSPILMARGASYHICIDLVSRVC